MRACLFGTYNRGHSANRIYAAAARAAGYDVVEIHEPLWERTRDKHAEYFAPLKLVALGARWLAAAFKLARRWHATGGAGVAIVGFNGQLDVILLKLLAWRYGPRVVFAPLVSITETLVDDRGVYAAGSLMARVLGAIDRLACRCADVIVADTQEHRRYFVERLGVDPARVAVCHLGVDNEMFMFAPVRRGDEACGEAQPDTRSRAATTAGVFASGGSAAFAGAAASVGAAAAEAARTPIASAPARKLEVLYFGQYLPLHGLDVVVDAIGRLATRVDLRFTLIGTGEERERIEKLVRATRADAGFLNWVPYAELGARIRQADIVLGIFGRSTKARMVIPNKVYEAATVGCAVITADTPAVREVFSDREHMLLCQSDGASLASAIAELAADPALRQKLAVGAARVMAERFSPDAMGRVWGALLDAGGDAAATVGSASASATAAPLVGVTILNFNDSDATLACLASLAQSTHPNLRVVVVDNGSIPVERQKLEGQMAGRFHARVLWLESNLGYARANNLAIESLFEQGCQYVLLLNDDTLVAPDAISALVRAARRHPGGGPVGPRVARDRLGAPAASRGERYWPALLWAPRTLLRHRRRRQRCYPVRGLMGCAILFSRSSWDRLGGFDETLFAYYEEVELFLRARQAGLVSRVEPMAEIAHDGHRGFASGFTPVAAYLKARNLWQLGRRYGLPSSLLFVPGYFALLAASTVGYLARGRADVVSAMYKGAGAGMRGERGEPPAWLFEAEKHRRGTLA